MPRPNTHDLLLSVIAMMDAALEKIEIVALKDGIFYAQLTMKQNDKSFIIDSRPSDSIALAVRAKCPIFIADSVVDEAGIPLTSITEEDKATHLSDTQIEKLQLEKDLEKSRGRRKLRGSRPYQGQACPGKPGTGLTERRNTFLFQGFFSLSAGILPSSTEQG